MSAPSVPPGPGLSESDVRGLIGDVQDLQRRVLRLEQNLSGGPIPAQESANAAMPERPAEPGVHLPANALPALGRALVAIAGAYVLRAITEFGVLPQAAGVAIGIAYAVVWLFVAARLPGSATFPIVLAAGTSVAILAPLLWEASVRLNVVSSATSATVLVGFAVVGLALSWRESLTTIPAIVSTSAALVAAILLLGTHDLLPFTAALLALSAGMELEACYARRGGARWLTALLADSAVLLLSWMVSRVQGLPEGFAPVSRSAAVFAALALVVIYASSAVWQTLVRRRTFSFLEAAQTAAALVLGIVAISRIAGTHPGAPLTLGLFALAAGLGCYAVSFRIVEASNKWNFRAWATFGLFLVLAGTFLPFSAAGFGLLWCGCAVVCCWTAMTTRRPTLGLHGAVYLLGGSIATGAAIQPASMFFGLSAGTPPWSIAGLVGGAAVLSWVAVARTFPGETARWRNQVSSFVVSGLVAWLLGGFVTRLLVLAWRATGPGDGAPVDALGTVVLTVLSCALAWAATCWQRREFAWLVYGFMGLCAWKLATRDFPRGHSLSLVVSLVFYGGALILLPRVLQKREHRGPTVKQEDLR